MKRIIELKHVGPRRHVQSLLEELIDRLEEKLGHFSPDAVSLHAVFEENGSHKLYRASLTCHVPGHVVAAHEEQREAGTAIREAFAELERQLEKQKAILRHEHLVRRSKREPRKLNPSTSLCLPLVFLSVVLMRSPAVRGEEVPSTSPSPKAIEAMRLMGSDDPYQQELGFLRLEALREPSTADAVRGYLTSLNPDTRAYSLRALAAIEGAAAVPQLLEALRTEKQPRVRRAALLGLEPLQPTNPEILPAFLKALRDRKPEVRMTAVDIVSRIDDPRAREAILLRNKREHERDVQRVLELAMKRLGTP